MDNLNDLKAIWLTAKTDGLPSSDEMLQIVRKFRNQKLRKKLILISMAIFTGALMITVIFIYKSTMITTRIGEVLMIATCVIIAGTNIKSIKRFYKLDDCSNKEFIKFLEQTRVNQVYFYKKTQVAGLTLCSIGLLLYLYEMVYKDTVLAIIVYAATIAYLLIMWLVVRPRIFKREAKKLKATMDRLEKISNQIE